MKHEYLAATILLFALALGGCAQQNTTPNPEPGEPTDPDVPTRSLQYFIVDGPNAPLFYKAIRISGVYDNLSVDRYPLLLMASIQEDALETYIAEQGLSEAEFLAHPKLPEFVRSHLIYDKVDVLELRTTPGAKATFKSAAGTEVVIENESASGTGSANGVAIDLFCSESEDPTYNTDAKGLLCKVAEPIVKDFDWSR